MVSKAKQMGSGQNADIPDFDKKLTAVEVIEKLREAQEILLELQVRKDIDYVVATRIWSEIQQLKDPHFVRFAKESET